MRKLRKQRKLSQHELAEQIDSDQKQVSRIERGEARPNLILCLRLANAFYVSVDTLLDGVVEYEMVQTLLNETSEQLLAQERWHRSAHFAAGWGICSVAAYSPNSDSSLHRKRRIPYLRDPPLFMSFLFLCSDNTYHFTPIRMVKISFFPGASRRMPSFSQISWLDHFDEAKPFHGSIHT